MINKLKKKIKKKIAPIEHNSPSPSIGAIYLLKKNYLGYDTANRL